jgi:hypothetical protein
MTISHIVVGPQSIDKTLLWVLVVIRIPGDAVARGGLLHFELTPARRILFRTIFLKANLHSFGKLSKISEHESLRHYVEVFIYNRRELEFAEGSGFEEWLHHTAAGGIGIPTDKREKFLARFSQ